MSDLENSKLKVLALNSDSKYGTSGEKKTAYKILTIAGDKIGDDKNNDAKFTVTEFDQLANEGEFEIKATVSGTSYQIGAIRFTTSDTKTYVTTVDEADKAKIAKATLGTNSYLDASVLLKEDAMNVVNIYFTSNEKSWNDEEGAQREYHKYLVADGSSAGLVALAQNHVDFTSPLAQWIVSDFDGKYTFTLTNRETGKTLGLRLAEDGKEGGYEVVGTVTGGYTAISTGVTSSTPISGTSVKFNTIPTTQYDSYRLFTEEEMEAGIALVFSGKNAVIGRVALAGDFSLVTIADILLRYFIAAHFHDARFDHILNVFDIGCVGVACDLVRNVVCDSADLVIIHLVDVIDFVIGLADSVHDLGDVKRYFLAVSLNDIHLDVHFHFFHS